jgi:Cwf15/Cwc15 cell cycle control protein
MYLWFLCSSVKTCSKDQIGHTKLKYRQVGQASKAELEQKDFKGDLVRKEQESTSDRSKLIANVQAHVDSLASSKQVDPPEAPRLLLANEPSTIAAVAKKYDDADADAGDSDRDLESSR